MAELLPYAVKWKTSAMGKTRIGFDCPVCGARVIGYVWSLAGSGKRCTCGALHSLFGTRPAEKRSE